MEIVKVKSLHHTFEPHMYSVSNVFSRSPVYHCNRYTNVNIWTGACKLNLEHGYHLHKLGIAIASPLHTIASGCMGVNVDV